MRPLSVLLVPLVLACGGREEPARAPASAPPAVPVAPAVPVVPPAPVHEVHMELVKGKYRFSPDHLTIRAGDIVRWVNVSGGPHNVAFKKDRIPDGARDVLNAAMPGRIQDLYGPFLRDSLATYQVSFAGAPPGSYTYVCTPHEQMGMVGTVSVSP